MSHRQLQVRLASRWLILLRVASLITIAAVGMVVAYLIVQAGFSGLNSGLNHMLTSKASVAPHRQYIDAKTREVVGLVFALAVPIVGIRVLAEEIFSRTIRSRRVR